METGTEQIMDRFNKACEKGDDIKVRDLLSDVSRASFPRKELEAKLMPPIYWACKGGNVEVVKCLIEGYPGCNIRFLTDAGSNLLYVACTRGHIDVVRFLYEVYSINPMEPNNRGTTPIFAATYKGHLEMLKYLIHHLNCDPRSVDPSGESLLHIACGNNHLDIARYLVEEHNLMPTLENAFRKTPLYSACSGGSLEVVEYLVGELHCPVNIFDQNGYTPLHIACRNGYADIVEFFIKHKHDLCLYDNSGFMPFHVACRFGRKHVVKVLLGKGNIDPNIRTITDLTALQIVVKDIKDEDTRIHITKDLIQHGADTSGLTVSIFQEYKMKYPFHSTIHVFMIGHAASGKSTLVKALQQVSTIFTIGRDRACMHVKPHTVGVVPIELNSPEFGQVILYDFAGDYEFHPSHAALLEHSKFTSPPLFILVLNLLNTLEESKK